MRWLSQKFITFKLFNYEKDYHLAIALVFIFGTRTFAQSTEWITDISHTTVQFSVSHLVISQTTGLFKNFESKIISENEDFEDARIIFEIMIESIDTDDETRDKHLLSGDFFDVENFPDNDV